MEYVWYDYPDMGAMVTSGRCRNQRCFAILVVGFERMAPLLYLHIGIVGEVAPRPELLSLSPPRDALSRARASHPLLTEHRVRFSFLQVAAGGMPKLGCQESNLHTSIN